MSARVSPAERVALPVARAALESRESAYGAADTIVFALGAAGLLATPEVVAAFETDADEEYPPGRVARMRTAMGAMAAARRMHGEGLVPMLWALENAGLLQSPETAAELLKLRGEVVELREQLAARTFYFADVEGIDDGQALHTTADAAKAWVEEVGGLDGDWFERDGVWEQWHCDQDTDQPTSRGDGVVLPLVVQGDGIVAEAERWRQELLEKSRKLALLMEVRADEQAEIRRLQAEQGQVMKALGCGRHDEWDDVVHRAERLARGEAVAQ